MLKMSSATHQYTLVGFSEEIDRRPLLFVAPLSATRICSACGLVPRVSAVLVCGHVFCQPCYRQCKRSKKIYCPLDGEDCREEQVFWEDLPAKGVLKKKVFCWNQANGCNVVTVAADISKHFHHECGHHLAKCPKCAAEILATEVCKHLESHCGSRGAPRRSGVSKKQDVPQGQECLSTTASESVTSSNSMSMSSIQAELIDISHSLKMGGAPTTSCDGETNGGSLETRKLRESLSEIRIEMAKQQRQLDEFMEDATANQQILYDSFVKQNEVVKQILFKAGRLEMGQSELAPQFAAFREAMGDRHRETKAQLQQFSLKIDSQCNRSCELLRYTPALLLSSIPFATKHTWMFEEFESLRKKQKKSAPRRQW
ncbi:uncharacterized protein LOC144141641 [Haemaphysalis longicornis]